MKKTSLAVAENLSKGIKGKFDFKVNVDMKVTDKSIYGICGAVTVIAIAYIFQSDRVKNSNNRVTDQPSLNYSRDSLRSLTE